MSRAVTNCRAKFLSLHCLWAIVILNGYVDRFFDEEQFEAYRELGVHVAEGLFSTALVGSGPAPTTVKDWFGRLSKRLLLPDN
jgi:hypothetical protein